MEDSENVNVAVQLDRISYAVMLVQENANVAGFLSLISVSELRMVFEELSLFVNSENSARGSRDYLLQCSRRYP